MEQMTRRNMLIGGSALLPFAAMPNTLFGESPSSAASPITPAKQVQIYNGEFVNYTAEALARGTAKRKLGTATAADYKSMPQNVKLLATHLELSGIDAGFKSDTFKKWMSDPDTQAAFAKSKIPTLSLDAFEGISKYAPSLSKYDFCADPNAAYTSDQINQGLAHLSQHGLSHALRLSADMLHASAPAAASMLPASFNHTNSPVLQYPNYNLHAPATFTHASNAWCSQKYKRSDVCQFLVAVGAALAGINLGVGCLILAAIFPPAAFGIGIGCVLGAGIIALVGAYLALNCTADS